MLAEIFTAIMLYKLLEPWVNEKLEMERKVDKVVAEWVGVPTPHRTFRDI